MSLCSMQVDSINAILRDYEAYGGVSFHWIVLSSSGHDLRPEGAVVDAYTACLPKEDKQHMQVRVTPGRGS